MGASRWLVALLLSSALGGAIGHAPAAAQDVASVELGKMGVMASPPDRLAQLHAKAVGQFRPGVMAHVYNLNSTDFGDYIIEFCDSYELIEDAGGNMALLWALWTTGTTSLTSVSPPSNEDLAGIFIGMAADPDKPVTIETVTLLATSAGVDPAALNIALIASKAANVQKSLAQSKEEHG